MINGWPDLLVPPVEAKARLDVLQADAESLQRLPFTSSAEIDAALDAILAWRERARTTFIETFEPAAAERFQADVAKNVLESFSNPAEKVAAAHGLLLDDISHVIVLGIWVDSADGKPMPMSPDEMITQIKSKHRDSAAAQVFPVQAANQTAVAPPSLGVIGWTRRATAFAIHIAFWSHVAGWWDAVEVYKGAILKMPSLAGIPLGSVLMLLAVGWLACLARLRIGWMFLLPFYMVFVPPALIIKWVGGAVLNPIVGAIQRLVNPSSATTTEVERDRRRRRQLKLWLFLWAVWYVALRNVEAPWVFWAPTVLALPLWYYGMKWSLTSAMVPPSPTLAAVSLCSRSLDETLRSWHMKNEKERKSAINTLALWATLGGFVARRYTGATKLITIQREAIIVFSAVLLAAFGLSCLWFGLLAQAILHTWPEALVGYNFFVSKSLVESTLWALGCMTTAVGFPGGGTSIPVKLLHAFILTTGIFQVTYLLACFSIISATDASRVSDRASVPVAALETRVSMALAIRESFELRAKPAG